MLRFFFIMPVSISGFLSRPTIAQSPASSGTTLILVGAILLVLIILGSVLWVGLRRK